MPGLPNVIGVDVKQPDEAVYGHHGENDQIDLPLRVFRVGRPVAVLQGQKVQGKLRARNQHERHADQLDCGAVEVADAGIVGREAAERNGRETVADGVEQAHAGQPVGGAAGDSEPEIDVPQGLGGFGDARRQLGVLDGTGDFSAVQQHATDTQHGQHGYRQHDDAHAAQPLQELAVEQHGVRHGVQVAQHRGAGSGEPGKGLEDGVGEGNAQPRHGIERQGAEKAEHGPEQHDDEEAVAHPQLFAVSPERQPQDQAGDEGDEEGEDKRLDAAVPVNQGDDHGGNHGEAEQCQQHADDAAYGFSLHAQHPRGLSPQPGPREDGSCWRSPSTGGAEPFLDSVQIPERAACEMETPFSSVNRTAIVVMHPQGVKCGGRRPASPRTGLRIVP